MTLGRKTPSSPLIKERKGAVPPRKSYMRGEGHAKGELWVDSGYGTDSVWGCGGTKTPEVVERAMAYGQRLR